MTLVRLNCSVIAARLWLAVVLTLSAGAAASSAEGDAPLRLVGPQFAPYYFYNDKHELDGALTALFDRIVNHAGLTWTGELVPPRRIVRELLTGTADASIIVKNPLFEEDEKMLRSREPVAEMVLNIYRQQGMPPAHVKEDLSGSRVLAIHGFGYGGLKAWIEDPANQVAVYRVDRYEQAIQMLEHGRVDYLLLYDVNFQEGLDKLHREARGVAHTTLSRVPLYLQISAYGRKDADRLLTRLMASYRELVEQGVIDAADHLPEDVIDVTN